MNKSNEILNVKWGITDVVVTFFLIILIYLSLVIISFKIFSPTHIDFSHFEKNSELYSILLTYLKKRWYIVILCLMINQLLYTFVPILWIKLRKFGSLRTLGLRSDRWLIYFFTGFILALCLKLILLLPIIITGNNILPKVPKFIASNQINYYINFSRAIIVSIIGPIGESIFFIGFAFPAFAKKMGIKTGAIVTTIIFTLCHGIIFSHNQFSIINTIWILFNGLLVIYLYWKRHSLLLPIGYFVSFNIFVLISVILNIRGVFH